MRVSVVVPRRNGGHSGEIAAHRVGNDGGLVVVCVGGRGRLFQQVGEAFDANGDEGFGDSWNSG